jgi:hypothetical protein
MLNSLFRTDIIEPCRTKTHEEIKLRITQQMFIEIFLVYVVFDGDFMPFLGG